jgi:D-serine deaminase-like pyridoxal phosphate-dependent protein
MTTMQGLETPFIFVDTDVVDRNIAAMQNVANVHGKKLRPHIKTHKVPLFAQRQIAAGATGICVQKTQEAEVMSRHGIRDILISNEVIGEHKTDRIANLASFSRMSVAVDSALGISQLSNSARQAGCEIGVFIDVDVGLERCGVRGDDAGKLAKQVSESSNLYLRGVMGYDGHTARIANIDERRKAVGAAWNLLSEAISSITAGGNKLETVSVGGTPSSSIWAEFEGVNELQPGTYIFNDAHQVELGVARPEECALKLMATVMSKATEQRAVIDAGSKSFAFDLGGFPMPVADIGGQVVKFAEEHGVIRSTGGPLRLQLGDRLAFIPFHACTAVDLWDIVYLCRGEQLLGELAIEARAART